MSQCGIFAIVFCVRVLKSLLIFFFAALLFFFACFFLFIHSLYVINVVMCNGRWSFLYTTASKLIKFSPFGLGRYVPTRIKWSILVFLLLHLVFSFCFVSHCYCTLCFSFSSSFFSVIAPIFQAFAFCFFPFTFAFSFSRALSIHEKFSGGKFFIWSFYWIFACAVFISHSFFPPSACVDHCKTVHFVCARANLLGWYLSSSTSLVLFFFIITIICCNFSVCVRVLFFLLLFFSFRFFFSTQTNLWIASNSSNNNLLL